jgi:predicted phosphodiesterase
VRTRGIAARAAAVAVCAALALAGSFVAVRAFASRVESSTLGTVRVEVEPAREGAVDVYIPIVDWGVRAEAFDAPVELKLRFRSLDRDAARRTLRSGTEAKATLASLRRDLAEVGRHSLIRAALVALAGGVGGGLLAGGLVGALRGQQRWIGYGAAAGAVVSAAFAGVALIQVRAIDYDAFERPTFYAQGRELPRLLSLSEPLLAAGESYTESYERALAGLANLVAFASSREGAPADSRSILVASDLHLNTLVLPVLDEYVQDKPVFFVGDFTLLGTSYERRLASDVATLGDLVVAVSGNHDSRPFMLALARAGAVVLTRTGRLQPNGSTDGERVVEVAGLKVAGYDDPLEGRGETVEGRPLELQDDAFDQEAKAFVAWFDRLEEKPDAVLVHQHGLAHALLASLPDNSRQLIILTGHDHKQHVEKRGRSLLVDGGTVGAGGPFAIGEQAVGFIELRLAASGRVNALDLIEVEPLSGEARAHRVIPGTDSIPDVPN